MGLLEDDVDEDDEGMCTAMYNMCMPHRKW